MTGHYLGNAVNSGDALKNSILPYISILTSIALVVAALCLVFSGYYYITSKGNPEKLVRAKKVIKNTFVGLIIIIGSSSIASIVQNAYNSGNDSSQNISKVEFKDEDSGGVGKIVNESIKDFAKALINSLGQPVVNILKQFTTATPLMAQNGAVFNLWVVVVAIADVLFTGVICLIGFRIMSSSVLGFEDVDLRSLLPQIIAVFLISNVSIFVIDALIGVSNAMIHALLIGNSLDVLWASLGGFAAFTANSGIGIVLLILVAVVLGVMLLVYYLKRLIVLYIGAVLSPVIVLMWLIPSFKDFAVAAAKVYVTTIFVLFVQVVILMLAVSLVSGLVQGTGNPLMTALLAIATLSVLLSTNRTMNHLATIGTGSQSMRKLGNTFVRGVSHVAGSYKQSAHPQGGVSVRRVRDTGMRVRSMMPAGAVVSHGASGAYHQGTASGLVARKGSPYEIVSPADAVHPINVGKRKGDA